MKFQIPDCLVLNWALTTQVGASGEKLCYQNSYFLKCINRYLNRKMRYDHKFCILNESTYSFIFLRNHENSYFTEAGNEIHTNIEQFDQDHKTNN